jgi:hypothetical protein
LALIPGVEVDTKMALIRKRLVVAGIAYEI